MTRSYTGTIHGNSIHLDASPELVDGQRVEVVVTACLSEEEWTRKAEKLAGALADLPSSVDEDMRKILTGRREEKRGASNEFPS